MGCSVSLDTPKVDIGYPIHLVKTNVVLMLGWLVLCITPLIGDVANGATLVACLQALALDLRESSKPDERESFARFCR